MSEAPTTTERTFREQFEELLGPFEEMLKLVRGKLAKAEAEVARLKGEEKEIVRGLRAINPEFERASKPGPKASSNGAKKASDEVVRRVLEFLESNRAQLESDYPRGFTATHLAERYPAYIEAELPSADYCRAALRVLHDRGVLRIDHRGTGGSKHYAMI